MAAKKRKPKPKDKKDQRGNMKIEIKKLSDLKPNPLNPRKSSVTQDENLKKSLEKFGVVEPIVFNKQSGFIVGGHFRVRELITPLGVEKAFYPCRPVTVKVAALVFYR